MKQPRVFRNARRRMHSNKKGGIEGLPLQLLIVIVIASLGLAMMIGWMNNIEEPAMIDDVSTSFEKNASGTYNVTVRVLDQNGNPVEGADVILTGYGAYQTVETTKTISEPTGRYIYGGTSYSREQLEYIGAIDRAVPETSDRTVTEIQKVGTPHGTTDSDGNVTISISFENLRTYGTLNVEVSKTGYSGTTTTMKVFA